jgi:glycine/D-amino acid oxidase-like deaminating enzyme
MIATEPLPEAFWDEVGWAERQAVSTTEHMFAYIQRTADDRIAIGSGRPKYHFNSATPEVEPTGSDYEQIRRTMLELFPSAADAQVTHRWGGYCATPRDWHSSVGFDRDRGIAWAGGYVGDGVTTAHLAGRTIRDLVLGNDTEETGLPWVNHAWQQWEPEPLRWFGMNLAMRVSSRMDRVEARTGRQSRFLGKVMEALVGTDTPSSPVP